jgi:uncharacterized delta-60 repeat protein
LKSFSFSAACHSPLVAAAATLLLLPTGKIFAQTPANLDATFGSSGKVVTRDFGRGKDLLVQPDGKILLGGETEVSGILNNEFAVIRYNTDGTLDSTFGTNGEAALNFDLYPSNYGSDDHVLTIALQPDGKILAAGYTKGENSDYAGTFLAIARFNADGSLDTTFGTDGKIKLRPSENLEITYGIVSLALQPDGKFIVAGASSSGSVNQPHGDFYLARLNANGTMDGTFGTGGTVTTHLLSDNSQAALRHIVLQPDGKIVLLGRDTGTDSDSNSEGGAVIIRYNADGSLDDTFGSGGIVLSDTKSVALNAIGFDTASDAQIEPDGKIIVAEESYLNTGTSQAQLSSFLLRLNADGTRDDTFGTDGFITRSIVPATLPLVRRQADGKYLLGGTYDGTNLDFLLQRFNADGSIDSDFGTNHGYTGTDFQGGDDTAWAMLLQPDGNVVLGGSSGEHLAMARYDLTPVTTPDPTTTGTTITGTTTGGPSAADAAYQAKLEALNKKLKAAKKIPDPVARAKKLKAIKLKIKKLKQSHAG